MLDLLAVTLIGYQFLILMYFLFINGTSTLFTVIALKDIRRYSSTITAESIRSMMAGGSFYRPLSIVAPAYNEQETIVSSLKSLLNLKFPEFEIIVVNDGSTDDTLPKLIREFKLIKIDKPLAIKLKHQPIRGIYISLEIQHLLVIDKENGGKADALNAGINASRFPLFCCIDADSLLDSNALSKAVRPFIEDKEVVATGGIVRVINGCRVIDGKVVEAHAPKRALECFQAVEYTRSFLSGRTAWNAFNSLLIISGAFSIFRKDILMAVDGYRHTVGEDMDLVLRIHKHCKDSDLKYKIIFVPDPVCWTQVPSDLKSLLKQRNRWQRGLIESLWYNRKMLLNPKYGAVGMFGIPYFIFVEALAPIVEFIGYFCLVIFYLLGYLSTDFVLLFFVLAVLWGAWINLGSVMLDNLIYMRYKDLTDVFKLCLFGLIEFLGPRQIILVERLLASFQFWKKEWGKPTRHAILTELPAGDVNKAA